jgi:hypothetical protein
MRVLSTNPRKAGLTLVEMTLSVTLMFIVSGTLVLAMESMGSLASTTQIKANLQTMADDALFDIVKDLRQSSTIEIGGATYPYVFDGGVPGIDFIIHAHDPAVESAEPGDSDAGPDREVVLLLPADADGDGRPDVDVNGDLVWDMDEVSYTVRTRADEVNTLERRVNGLNPRVIGRYVERIVVDTAESSSFVIPLGSVRVRLFFRQLNKDGVLLRYTNEAVIAMRN